MGFRVRSALSVIGYINKIYPREITGNEICEALGLSNCTVQRALQTLVARGEIEISGKRGRSNLYRYKQN